MEAINIALSHYSFKSHKSRLLMNILSEQISSNLDGAVFHFFDQSGYLSVHNKQTRPADLNRGLQHC